MKTPLAQFLASRIPTTIRRILGIRPSGVDYWGERVRRFGRRSVLNLAHGEDDYETVTATHKAEVFPHFKKLLQPGDRTVLDFGCGAGRFTPDLARMVQGRAIGVDPVPELLSMAPRSEGVEYRVMDGSIIPLSDGSVDAAWVCLVLGGITGEGLHRTVSELCRVLKKDGLLFLVENTSQKKDGEHWVFRSVRQYQDLFPGVRLIHLHDFYDVDERISIMAGRP